MSLGLKPGDEVITPSFTYIATTEVIALLRLKPVFVDVTRDGLIDPEKIEEKITKRTKAIVATDLLGHGCDVEKLKNICNNNKNLFYSELEKVLRSKKIYFFQ